MQAGNADLVRTYSERGSQVDERRFAVLAGGDRTSGEGIKGWRRGKLCRARAIRAKWCGPGPGQKRPFVVRSLYIALCIRRSGFTATTLPRTSSRNSIRTPKKKKILKKSSTLPLSLHGAGSRAGGFTRPLRHTPLRTAVPILLHSVYITRHNVPGGGGGLMCACGRAPSRWQ